MQSSSLAAPKNLKEGIQACLRQSASVRLGKAIGPVCLVNFGFWVLVLATLNRLATSIRMPRIDI